MKILITGGAGVIGTAVVSELLARGHAVPLLSRHADEDAMVRALPAVPVIDLPRSGRDPVIVAPGSTRSTRSSKTAIARARSSCQIGWNG